MPRVGTDFAGYRIQGILGRGGMSVVYQAEHPRLARVVALKVLALELAEDDRFRERFVRESRLAASLDHPNIVPIYDAGSADALLYIAMRFVKGDLKGALQREGRLRPERALPLIAQVASGLDAAHDLGLVHRDVKPANILIAFNSGAEGNDHVYLADFGLTKHATSRSGITGTGQFVGTVDYMAPEQIEGKQVDGRADVYALGCIVYQCLTGRVPFMRDTDAAVIWAHLREDPPRITDSSRDVPEGVDDVVARAMGKNADDRFPSCMALVAALREEIGGDSRYSHPQPLPGTHTVLRQRPGGAGIPEPPPAPIVLPDAGAASSSAEAPGRSAVQDAPADERPAAGQDHDGAGSSSAAVGYAEPPPAAGASSSSAPPARSAGRSSKRGRRRGALAGILVLLLLAGGAGGWYLLSDDEPAAGPNERPAAGGGGGHGTMADGGGLAAATNRALTPIGDFPDPVEALFMVPHIGVQNVESWDCTRPPLEEWPEDTVRVVSCAPGAPVDTLQYLMFHDGFRMREFLGGVRENQAIPPRSGDCSTGEGHALWGSGPKDGTHTIGAGGKFQGQVVCYSSAAGAPEIDWMDPSTKIVGKATGADPAALLAWWETESGPIHPSHVHNLAPGAGAAATGVVVQINKEGGRITSVVVEDGGTRQEVFFSPDREYECPLDPHLQEHQESGDVITLPIERVDGRSVALAFTHC
ncbi:MAG: serine/threonine-protein kinase [Actinomycetota bacterium]